MEICTQASAAPRSTQNATAKTVVRRSANFHPSIWGDCFLAYASNVTDIDVHMEQKVGELKEQVKKMILETTNKPSNQLNLIDALQRLGVSYHFECEIDVALEQMKDIYPCFYKKDDYDLHTVSLCFRLLRQHGHNVSTDAFNKFMDNNGEFKESLINNVRGMLSLYEASHLRVHGEHIMDEALDFTTIQLGTHEQNLRNTPLGEEVIHALEQPIHLSLTRLEARNYISIYQKYDFHSEILLNFAKFDFNQLQKMHQIELSSITRWWKDLDFARKLPFARDRIVECYFWVLGVYFEPQYLMARRILTKVIAMSSIIDDIYDVYATLEEITLFTHAIQRWEIAALDQLPDYMKLCYQALLDVYSEMEEEMAKEGKSYLVHFAKTETKRLVRAYYEEAKWYHEGYVPKYEEYMKVALVTGGYIMLTVTSFVGMGEMVTQEAFHWVSNDPLMVRAASVICRLTDDMVGHEFEQERGHVASAVECYMCQHGVTKKDAYGALTKKVSNAWKDMNQECLHPNAVPMPLLTRVLNLARAIHVMHKDVDGYTHSKTRTKKYITIVLIDPVPM